MSISGRASTASPSACRASASRSLSVWGAFTTPTRRSAPRAGRLAGAAQLQPRSDARPAGPVAGGGAGRSARAIALNPPHLSWYQLTIEPNTLFGSKPPKLPDDDALWDIFERGDALLTAAGYRQYETSAYAKPGYQCQHNLNYWRFGDYIGIGCGAHGKITFPDGRILRTAKTRHPRGFMEGRYLERQHDVEEADKPFEFFMNRFRLLERRRGPSLRHLPGWKRLRFARRLRRRYAVAI